MYHKNPLRIIFIEDPTRYMGNWIVVTFNAHYQLIIRVCGISFPQMTNYCGSRIDEILSFMADITWATRRAVSFIFLLGKS